MSRIVHAPLDVLSNPAKPVTSFDKKLKAIIDDMKKTLTDCTNPKGVGLAAPQIGLPLRIFITKPNDKAAIRVFINPEITATGGDDVMDTATDAPLEGCLSIPDVWGEVKRHGAVTLAYQDEKGQKHEERFTGFMATIVQHETDHLSGILFTQRVLEQKRPLYRTEKDEKGKEVLDEIRL